MHTMFLLLLSSIVAAAVEPVFQADFEAGRDAPSGWSFRADRGRCRGVWDLVEPAPRGRSLRLEIDDDPTARATWSYSGKIPVQPSTGYRLSLRAMVAQVGSSGRAFTILYENGVPTPTHWHMIPPLRGTDDWRNFEISFTTRPDTTWLKLQCKLWDATGYAWFDDLRIERFSAGGPPSQGQTDWQPADDGWPLQLAWYPAHRRPDRTLCLLSGRLNPVAMFPWGRKSDVREPCLVIETPRGLRVRGAVVHGTRSMPKPTEAVAEPFEEKGQARLRWRIALDDPALAKALRPDGPLWTEYSFVYVEPLGDCPAAFDWKWHVELAGRPGPTHSIAARLKARELGKVALPDNFPLYVQHTGGLRFPTAEGRKRLLDLLSYAGIRGGLSLTYWQSQEKPLDDELQAAGFSTWAWHWDGYNGTGTDQQRVVATKADLPRRLVCPQVQVERGEPWWSSLLARYRQRLEAKHKTLILNFEPPWYDVCFCCRCREALAHFAKVPPGQVEGMTPQAIQALPDHLWGRFRAEQNGQIVRNHVAAIHMINPEVRVGLCGPPYSEWNAQRGMDIRAFEPDVAFHAPMIYYPAATFESMIRSTCQHTRAPVLPFVLASDLAVPKVFPGPEELALNLLATALCGGRGAVLWTGIESLDAEYWTALRSVLGPIGEIQKYVIDGRPLPEGSMELYQGQPRRVTVGNPPRQIVLARTAEALRHWGWQSPRGRLVAAINYDRQSTYTLRVNAAGAMKAKSILGPAPRVEGGHVLVDVPPWQAAAAAW